MKTIKDKKKLEALIEETVQSNIQQGRAIKSIFTSDNHLFITGVAGSGKAQPVTCNILTPSGFKKMGDIKVGDEVIGRDGKPQEVLGVYPQGIRPVYKVIMNDGSFTYCDEEHLWAYRLSQHNGKTPFSRCSTLKEMIEMGFYKRCKSGERNRFPNLRFEIPMCDPIEYGYKDFDIHPYIIGVLLGDGSLKQGTALFSCPDSDIQIKENVESVLNDVYFLKKKKYHEGQCPQYGIVQYDTYSKGTGFINKIKSLGMNVGSGDKFIPDMYKYGSVDQRKALLAGLMDTDGTCSAERNRVSFSTTSERLANDMVDLVRSLGGIAKLRTLIREDKTYHTEYCVNVKTKFNPFTLDRKAKRLTPKPNRITRYIKSVEKVEDQECVCIKVSNEDELYITDNFIVTHNTYFMKKILPFIPNCAIVAPTGVAAINAGGATMHSFFRLDLNPYYPRLSSKGLMKNYNASGDPNFRKVLEKVQTIIIDEISMVRADTLDKISDVLQQTRKINRPFGGVRLIMFGDLNQLPPVLKEAESAIFYENYDSPYFFSSIALRMSGFEVVEFTKVYRQSDPVFIGLLNNVRSGKMTDEDIELLNSRMIEVPKDFEGMRIVTHNEMASKINESMVNNLDGEVYTFVAVERGSVPKDCQCERILNIKIGEQVVLTRNKTGEYYNGSIGVVSAINKDENTIRVKLLGKKGKEKYVDVSRVSWENSKYSVSNGSVHSDVIGQIIQYPIKAGYACTSHKAQGMTFDSVVIDAARSFTNGQAYVALSRCRTLEGTYLTSKITNDQLIQDEKIIEFYDMVKECDGIIKPVNVHKEMQEGVIDFSKFGL